MTTAQRTAVGSVARTQRSAQRPRVHQGLIGWSFALPFVLLFLFFMAGPLVASFLLSLTGFGLGDITNPVGASFVGLQNYIELLRDPRFLQSAFNTGYFVAVGVPLTLVVGLLAAIALNQAVVRFKSLFRVGYYLPVVTSIVAIAVIWRFLLHPDQGLVNVLLAQVGFHGPNWLADPLLSMPSIIAMAVWRNFGFSMVIFLAGLQTISVSLYEAARIDGAGRWQEFRYVTLPGLRPTLLFTIVTTSIGYLNLFEEPFVMTGGGPLDKTLSVTMYLYQQGFTFFRQGYAAAVAYVLFAAVVLLALVQFRLLRSED
jgi:multiple sugar transport system permease protein